MDGKTLRGTLLGIELRGTHLPAIYVPKPDLVFVEAEVERKEKEIVVAPKIPGEVNLVGLIVIADAMHTQREISVQIVVAVDITSGLAIRGANLSPGRNYLASKYMGQTLEIAHGLTSLPNEQGNRDKLLPCSVNTEALKLVCTSVRCHAS